jgi:hydroxymethylpyrimidine kinase/phosphomethylpyrimidine kinase
MSGEIIAAQLEALFADFEIAAVKTGMLPTSESVEVVCSIVNDKPVANLVVDPVARSTSGYELADKSAVEALRVRLIPRVALITPNWYEAELLSGITVRDSATAEQAARAIVALGARAVLITGGDSGTDGATDLLVDAEGILPYAAPRIDSRNTHGTGCALASAIACFLARGITLREAITRAKEYVRQAILAAPALGRGNGPLNHFPPGWEQ